MNTENRLTGSALEKALRSGGLDAPSLEIVGMVKASDEEGRISFSATDCESWTDVPTDLIKHAERVGESPCRDHTHPVFRLVLADSDDPAAKVLSAVLASWRRSRHEPVSHRGPGRAPGPRSAYLARRFRPGGGGGFGLTNSCTESYQNCYVKCSLLDPGGAMQDACLELCDEIYDDCVPWPTAGGLWGPSIW